MNGIVVGENALRAEAYDRASRRVVALAQGIFGDAVETLSLGEPARRGFDYIVQVVLSDYYRSIPWQSVASLDGVPVLEMSVDNRGDVDDIVTDDDPETVFNQIFIRLRDTLEPKEVVPQVDLLASRFLDSLGRLLQERDALLDEIARLRGDLDDAEHTIELLQSQLDSAKAASAVDEKSLRSQLLKGVAKLVLVAIPVAGVIDAAAIARDGSRASARIAAEATDRASVRLQKSTRDRAAEDIAVKVLELASADGDPSDRGEIWKQMMETANLAEQICES